MTIAAINRPVGSHQSESDHPRKLLPTAWSSPPLPLRADSWSSLWYNPLRQAGLLLVQVAATMIVASIVVERIVGRLVRTSAGHADCGRDHMCDRNEAL